MMAAVYIYLQLKRAAVEGEVIFSLGPTCESEWN